MDYGWIKLHRKMRENPLLRRPAYRAVWIEMLLEAEHGMKNVGGKWQKKEPDEMKSTMWKGERIYLKAGQFTCGAKQMSEWTGVPRGTVERIIKVFAKCGMIEEQTSNKYSLITVKKWKEYQQDEEQVRNKRGTSEEQVRTPKECKNDKNEKMKDKSLATTSVAEPINQVFKIFYDSINPQINYGNRTWRKATEDLIKSYGLEEVLKLTEVACTVQGQEYAPTITNPYQLKEKLALLQIFIQRANQPKKGAIQSL